MKRTCSMALVGMVWALAVPSLARSGGTVTVRGAYPVQSLTTKRVYIEASGADESRVLQLRRRLIQSGAERVNLFLPTTIVCELPPHLDPGVLIDDPAFSFALPSEVGIDRVASRSPGSRAAVQAYELSDLIAPPEHGDPDAFPGDGGPHDGLGGGGFNDVVLSVPPEVVERSREASRVSPAGAFARNIQQNAEFLVGDVLLQMILPESEGFDENWTDRELADAVAGGAAACLAYQQSFTHAPMHFIFRSERRAPTIYEPIHYMMDTDPIWIGDVMQKLGYASRDVALTVHEYNEAGRSRFGTDWAYTAFIALSRNEPGHRFRGSNYTAYAFLGGPYVVIPFPAGDTNPLELPENQIFSQIYQHEMGHIFWALDEYPAAPSDCMSHTGYLDYLNRNKVTDDQGTLRGCPTFVNCLMWNPRVDGRPVCVYTAGQTGVIDVDDDNIPDVFDAPPVIVFQNSEVETTEVARMTIQFKAISIAVPNRNPAQVAVERVDYAAPLMDTFFSVDGVGATRLVPLDGEWDEAEEDLALTLQGLNAGLTAIQVRARNAFGRASDVFEKRIYFIGVKFALFDIDVRPASIRLGWNTIGETFGAVIDVYRTDLTAGETEPTLMATLDPATTPGPFHPYSYDDDGVVPGHEYRYFVRARFALEVNGETRQFATTSGEFTVRAMLPIERGELVSRASPNPFAEKTLFSIDVPRRVASSGGPSGVESEVPTSVEVAVYDVAGRRVKEIYRGSMYARVETFQWDGTNANDERVPSGIYFIKAAAGGLAQTKKVVLVR